MPERAEEVFRLSLHRYPISSLLTDGFRAVFGLLVAFGPLVLFEVALPLAILLGAAGAVFFIFALKLSMQVLTSIELTETGIYRHGPVMRSVDWSYLKSMKLAHFATPKRPESGWYQLSIRARNGGLTIDSTIDGFDRIVVAAAKAARDRSLVLDPATGENLKALAVYSGQGEVSS